MASALKLIFLLTFFMQKVNGEQETHELQIESDTFDISVLSLTRNADFCLVSRSMADGELLLWNTSDSSPVNSTLHGELTDRLSVRNLSQDLYLEINKVSQSDSGRYRIECRTGRKVTYQKNFTLSVCDWKPEVTFYGTIAELPCNVAAEENLNPTIIWFRLTRDKWRPVFVDGSSGRTLNSEMKELQGRVQMLQNNSLLISNFTNMDALLYTCLVLEEKKCGKIIQSYTERQYYYLRSEKQGFTLPCFSFPVDPAGTSWKTPHGEIKADIPSKNPPETSSPKTQRQEEMYMMDGTENNNYSLVIPSLELNHSGWYFCDTDISFVSYRLLVCPGSTSLTVFFSEGSEVSLSCGPDSVDADVVVWFNNDERVILEYTYKNKYINRIQWDERYNVSLSFTTLTFSNLSQEDSGDYCCVRYTKRANGSLSCESLARTYLVYQSKHSLGSVFLAVRDAVGSCALIGAVCAVVTVFLRSWRTDRDAL